MAPLKTKLTIDDYLRAAAILKCDHRDLMAFALTESNGNGFLKDGSPKILFEGHVFWRLLKKDRKNPESILEEFPGHYDNVLYEEQSAAIENKYYLGGKAEYTDRLYKAFSIDPFLSFESCSWGMFQIMGYHWKILGYHDVIDFTFSMRIGADKHLDAFIKFMLHFKIDKMIRDGNMMAALEAYNGPKFKELGYDKKFNHHRSKLT